MRKFPDAARDGQASQRPDGATELRVSSTTPATEPRGKRKSAEGERQPVEVVGWYSDAEVADQVRRRRWVRGVSPTDVRLSSRNTEEGIDGPTESADPIGDGDKKEPGHSKTSLTLTSRTRKRQGVRVDRLRSKALEEEFVSRAKADLEPVLPSGDLRDFIHSCLKGTRASLGVAKAAESAGLDAAAMVKLLDDAGYPPADDIIMWCRVLRAGWFLARLPQRSGELIAETLGFGSRANLCKTIQELTRLHVGRLHADATYSILMLAFCKKLQAVTSPQVGAPATSPRH